MKTVYSNNYKYLNVYKKRSTKSEVVTQMVYGDNFHITKSYAKWLDIKIIDDGYKGFVVRGSYKKQSKPTHKVSNLKANIYSLKNKQKKISELSFGSKINVSIKKLNYCKFEKGWVNIKET